MNRLLLSLVSLTMLVCACEEETSIPKTLSEISSISLPTSSPRGIAFDGSYLWYSDDADQCLYKISPAGELLDTIALPGTHLTSFEFYNDYIWVINDTTVVNDPKLSNFPFSCIYQLYPNGVKMDSLLLEGSPNPQRPEFTGLTVRDNKLYGSTSMGEGPILNPYIYTIDFETKTFDAIYSSKIAGITCKDSLIYGMDKELFKYNDRGMRLSITGTYTGLVPTDITTANGEFWVCDRKNQKLLKITQAYQ